MSARYATARNPIRKLRIIGGKLISADRELWCKGKAAVYRYEEVDLPFHIRSVGNHYVLLGDKVIFYDIPKEDQLVGIDYINEKLGGRKDGLFHIHTIKYIGGDIVAIKSDCYSSVAVRIDVVGNYWTSVECWFV